LVRLTVRTFTLAIAVAVGLTTLAAPAVAVADDADDDEMYEPVPPVSIAVGVQGHGSRVGGRYETGFGPSLELALGRGRWQYLVEGSAATSHSDAIVGSVMRGALGARWIARQFQLDSKAALELLLLGTVGLKRFAFDADALDGRLVRPEVGVGFGLQMRAFRRPRLGFRIDVRALFTTRRDESSIVVCRANCMTGNASSTGLLMGMTFAW
jgi:hypothetical protein